MLKKLRNNIGIIILIVVFGLILLGASYVNVGPTTEFEGDVGVPAGSGYYIGDVKLDIDDFVGGAWHSTHLEDQLFFGELAGIANVKYSKFDATSAPTINDDVDLDYVVGSRWCDVTNDKEYICLDNTDGAAVWTETTIVGVVDTSGTPVDNDYAKFTDANTIEGRDTAQVKTDLGFMTDVIDDTTPELDGELDAGANTIGFTQQTITYNVTTTTVDWTNGNKATMTFGAGNIGTFAFTNPTNSCNVLIKIIQDGTGSRTVTAWDGDIKWAGGGTAPTLSTAANSIDIISFYWDGTNYFGVASLDFQ